MLTPEEKRKLEDEMIAQIKDLDERMRNNSKVYHDDWKKQSRVEEEEMEHADKQSNDRNPADESR